MATTREVPFIQWESFLNGFSNRNQGRPARLETAVPAGEGEPVLAEHRPLRPTLLPGCRQEDVPICAAATRSAT
jgi:hypothetical protein